MMEWEQAGVFQNDGSNKSRSLDPKHLLLSPDASERSSKRIRHNFEQSNPFVYIPRSNLIPHGSSKGVGQGVGQEIGQEVQPAQGSIRNEATLSGLMRSGSLINPTLPPPSSDFPIPTINLLLDGGRAIGDKVLFAQAFYPSPTAESTSTALTNILGDRTSTNLSNSVEHGVLAPEAFAMDSDFWVDFLGESVAHNENGCVQPSPKPHVTDVALDSAPSAVSAAFASGADDESDSNPFLSESGKCRINISNNRPNLTKIDNNHPSHQSNFTKIDGQHPHFQNRQHPKQFVMENAAGQTVSPPPRVLQGPYVARIDRIRPNHSWKKHLEDLFNSPLRPKEDPQATLDPPESKKNPPAQSKARRRGLLPSNTTNDVEKDLKDLKELCVGNCSPNTIITHDQWFGVKDALLHYAPTGNLMKTDLKDISFYEQNSRFFGNNEGNSYVQEHENILLANYGGEGMTINGKTVDIGHDGDGCGQKVIMYHCDLPSNGASSRRWVFFLICRPILSMKNVSNPNRPGEPVTPFQPVSNYQNVPFDFLEGAAIKSWVMFAMPVDLIEQVSTGHQMNPFWDVPMNKKDKVVGVSNEFRFCNPGANPMFQFAEKSVMEDPIVRAGVLAEEDLEDNYLSCQQALPYMHNLNSHVRGFQNEEYEMRRNWYEHIVMLRDHDILLWQKIRRSMEHGTCRVVVKQEKPKKSKTAV